MNCTNHLIKSFFEIAFLTELVALSEQGIGVLGEQFRRFRVRCPSSGIAVDELSTGLAGAEFSGTDSKTTNRSEPCPDWRRIQLPL